MKLKSEVIEKRYWGLQEIATELNEKPYTIRFWLREFDIDRFIHRPVFGNKDRRKFSAMDRVMIREIHRLIRVEKFTLEGVKRQLSKLEDIEAISIRI